MKGNLTMHSCDNCGSGTENEPLTLCDECDAQDRLGIDQLKARVAELEHWLGLAVEANRVLDSCTDGYYRADESDEVKAWDAVEDAVKESLNRK